MENIYDRPPHGRALAMVYGVRQRLERVYDARQALRAGTLFPELNKPMNEASMPIDGPNATIKQMQEFSAWELRLYLNTHPDDQRALDLFKRLCDSIEGAGYPCAFVQTGACGAGYGWINDPWPWEFDNCGQTEGTGHVCV